MPKNLRSLLGTLAVCAYLFSCANSSQAENAPVPGYSKGDRYFGVDPKRAKVVMIEYGSLTCSHCSDFFNKYIPKLKSKYIKNGKSFSIIHRIFVADAPSLLAVMALKCKDLSDEKYNTILSLLYSTSPDWAFSNQFAERIEDIFVIHGYTKEEFRRCIENQDIKNQIIKERTAAVNAGLFATPSIFINGKLLKSIGSSNIEQEIEEQLNK